jgi:hypothetical protein
VTEPRVLYISPINMSSRDGMMHLQRQILAALCATYGKSVDLLSLGAPAGRARNWLRDAGLSINVLQGFWPWIARLNATLWYGGGVILCNKLRWIDRFYFPLQTPLPRRRIERYDVIVCFYPWAHRLLRLERAGRKVVVCTGDVMADRHERIGARRWISLQSSDERSILESDSRCLAVSQDDRKEFQRLYGVELPVLQFLPTSYPELISLSSRQKPQRVGYLGAASYVNEQVLLLLSQPAFLECLSRAGIELIVAGGICDTAQPSIIRALKRGGARVLGPIDSALDFYSQITAALNPVGPSTGIKIKSVEALMAGCSLITTRWGADESLQEAFGAQITYIDMPIEPSALAKVAVDVVRAPAAVGGTAAKTYAERSIQILHSLLLPYVAA